MKTAADLPIVKACPLEGELPGQGARRHCSSCDTLVVDLSLLTETDADALLKSAARPRCVSYQVDEQGAVLHLPASAAASAPARRRLPILAGALLLAACNGAAGEAEPKGAATSPVATATPAATSVAKRGEIEPPSQPAAAPAPDHEGCEVDPKAGTSSTTTATTPPLPKPLPPAPRPIRLRGKPAPVGDPF